MHDFAKSDFLHFLLVFVIGAVHADSSIPAQSYSQEAWKIYLLSYNHLIQILGNTYFHLMKNSLRGKHLQRIPSLFHQLWR